MKRRLAHHDIREISMSSSKVGIFFVVDNEVLFDAVSVQQGERCDNFIEHGGHYDFWDKLKPSNVIEQIFKDRAYDAYPRGRIVYFIREQKFRLYADTCLNSNDLKLVKEVFGIRNAVRTKDEHYQCASCNLDFMD